MLLEHERNHDLGMDALVTVCAWNTNNKTVWPRRGFDSSRGRSLQGSAPALKVCRAKLGHGQLHFADAGHANA